MKNRYHDNKGARVTVGLFKEYVKGNYKYVPPYSIHECKKKYMEFGDPTEYRFAMWLVEDFGHWLEVRNHPTLKPTFDEWALELDARIRSEAVNSLLEHAKQPGGTAAAKWLAENGYKEKETKPVGRPKKVVDKELEIDTSRVAKDMGRLGLIVGGKS